MLHHHIPFGADGWRLSGETEWKPVSALPQHWLKYLNDAGTTQQEVEEHKKAEKLAKGGGFTQEVDEAY